MFGRFKFNWIKLKQMMNVDYSYSIWFNLVSLLFLLADFLFFAIGVLVLFSVLFGGFGDSFEKSGLSAGYAEYISGYITSYVGLAMLFFFLAGVVWVFLYFLYVKSSKVARYIGAFLVFLLFFPYFPYGTAAALVAGYILLFNSERKNIIARKH